MTCKKYKILLAEYIEGTLSESEKHNLESHLETCSRCKRELELLQNYKKYLSSFEQRKAPESIRDNVWKTISEESTAKQEERNARIIPLNLGWVVIAASLLALVLIIPPVIKPQEITINFDYQAISDSKGPVEEAKAGAETDPRVSTIFTLAEKLECEVKKVYTNPAGMTDGMVVRVPKTKYNSFRQEFNSYNVSNSLPSIFFRSMRGSILVQVYFSGRNFFTGDFDNDSRIDLGAYFSRGKTSGEFFVAFNDGKDGFRKPVRLSINDTLKFLSRFDEILCGDFNNDGFDDMLIRFSTGINKDSWIIYMNDGKEGFEKGIKCKSGEEQFVISDQGYSFTGDFNGDGYTDIGMHYISGKNQGRFFLAYNNQDLSFNAPVEFITGLSGLLSGEKYTPLILDINNDNFSDIILYWQEGERNAIWYISENTKSGAGDIEYKAGFNKGTMAFWGKYLPFTGDIDGDGYDDLLVKNGTSDEVSDWYLMKNDGDGSFTTAGHSINFNGEIDLIVQ
jgi:hypothetical protein